MGNTAEAHIILAAKPGQKEELFRDFMTVGCIPCKLRIFNTKVKAVLCGCERWKTQKV
jgi:uncharacterized protein (DUF302 family)